MPSGVNPLVPRSRRKGGGRGQRRRRLGLQGLLEDELCPDEMEGWKLHDASPAVVLLVGIIAIKA